MDRPRSEARYRWYAVGLLALVNLVNYMDRVVLSVLVPAIKTDLELSDTELGFLTGFAFAVFYAAFGLPLARWADRGIRRNIIAGALALWSVMTAATGGAQTFLQLALARVGVGVGEAGCIPPSQSMISDYVPRERRAGALGLHTAGATIGAIIGFAVGGYLSVAIGWRWTLVVMGAPGILLALVVRFTLREPPRGHAEGLAPDDAPPPLLATLRDLMGRRALVHVMFVFAFASFASAGVVQWLPSFYVRSFGLSAAEIGPLFGLAYGIGSTTGTLGGGFVADRLARLDVRWGLWLPAACYAIAFPLSLGVYFASSAGISLVALTAFMAIASVPNGALFSLIQGLAPPRARALAVAVNMFGASVIGIGGGPLVAGWLSDQLTPSLAEHALQYALATVTAVMLWPIVHCLLGARRLRADLDRVRGAS